MECVNMNANMPIMLIMAIVPTSPYANFELRSVEIFDVIAQETV